MFSVFNSGVSTNQVGVVYGAIDIAGKPEVLASLSKVDLAFCLDPTNKGDATKVPP